MANDHSEQGPTGEARPAGGEIHYLNTDLNLESAADLTALAAALERAGVYGLHVGRDDDGRWRAHFEANEEHDGPEGHVAAMLAAVESLDPPLRAAWAGCTRRVFDMGYECGAEPRLFERDLSAELLARVVRAGASLRLTLYAARD